MIFYMDDLAWNKNHLILSFKHYTIYLLYEIINEMINPDKRKFWNDKMNFFVERIGKW
jgi:hypothetical protein